MGQLRGPVRKLRARSGRLRWAALRAVLLIAIALAAAQTAASMRHARGTAQPAIVAAYATPTPAFPLKVAGNARYLVDQKGRPVLLIGDSPQSMTVNLSTAEATAYMADRESLGFNTLWVNLLTTTFAGGRSDGTTYDGIAPFRVPGDIGTPNPAYFNRVDRMVATAAKDGFVLFLNPIETGGWLPLLRRNGVAKAYAYGAYLGRRYRRFPNIVWFHGNDFHTWKNSGDDAVVLAVARGVKSTDPRSLQTVELEDSAANAVGSGSLQDPRWKPLIGIDSVYTYQSAYRQVLAEYDRRQHLPVVLAETSYEGEPQHGYLDPQTLRRQEYWSLLSGASGYIYGQKYVWPFASGWQQNLDTPGARNIAVLESLFAPLDWYDLVPDQQHKIVVAGYSVRAGAASINDDGYASAAATPDGRLLIAYLPAIRPLTVDLSKLAPGVVAHWFDPTSGAVQAATGEPASGSSFSYTPPGQNSAGASDWVLVVAPAS